MPGTVVRDALATDLLADVDLADEGAAQNGTAFEIGWPGLVQFSLEVASVTGTSPTLDLTIQGSESSDFSTDPVVTIAEFPQVGDVADGTHYAIQANVNSKFVRAVADVGGTTVVYTATLEPVPLRDRETRGAHPTATALA